MGDMLADRAKAFAAIKERKEYYEHLVSLCNQQLESLGRELFADFTSAGMKSFRLDGTKLFGDGRDRILYPDVKIRGTIANQPVFFDILKKSGSGSLIKETVHHASLEKWIIEQKKKNLPLPEESVLKVWSVETAKVRRAPSASADGTDVSNETIIEGE